MRARLMPSGTFVGCLDCGTRQRTPRDPHGTVVRCVACAGVLQRKQGRSLSAALACSAAALLLLLPANFATFMGTDLLGMSRESVLASAARVMLTDGLPLLALVMFLFLVVLPAVRFGLLVAVLGTLARRHRWHGRVFRWTNALETWAMADVFLLGLLVAYARLAASIATRLGVGALAFAAVGILSLLVRALLDKGAVWERIAPAEASGFGPGGMECRACELLVPLASEGKACPRCAAILKRRKPESLGRTLALTTAALLFYIPANFYPIATLPINNRPTRYTVFEGVIDLSKAGLWDLALLVFFASFAIPVLKLLGLGWCMFSVMCKSRRRLRAKTRAYRVVEEIGRWSMVDPFVIGAFVPVMDYKGLIYARAEPGALPFAAVVILTIVSAKTFDPRLMWDAAGARS